MHVVVTCSAFDMHQEDIRILGDALARHAEAWSVELGALFC